MTIISLTRPASCHRFFVLDVSISNWLILLTYVTDFSIEYRRAPIKRYVGMTLLTIRLAQLKELLVIKMNNVII